jgi:hypothetical protein
MRPKQVRRCEVKEIPIVEKLTRRDYQPDEFATGYSRFFPVNPDGPEAAAIIKELVEALEKARDRFTEYASQHQQKAFATTVDRERDERMTKADSNLDMALMCDRALTRAQMQP